MPWSLMFRRNQGIHTMKKIVLSMVLATTAASAHEGHNHGLASSNPTAPADFSKAAGHLSFEGRSVHAHASWKQAPVHYQEAVLRLQFRDGDTHAVVDPQLPVSVDIWHPLFGLGVNQIFVKPAKQADGTLIPGTYDASNIYFLRGGGWEVRVSLAAENGTEEVQTFTQPIVSLEDDPWLDPNDPIHSMHDMSMMNGMNHGAHGNGAKNNASPNHCKIGGNAVKSNAAPNHAGHEAPSDP